MNRFISIAFLVFFSAISNADNQNPYPPCTRPFEGMERHFFLLERLNPSNPRIFFLSKQPNPKWHESLTQFWMQCAGKQDRQKIIVSYDKISKTGPLHSDLVYYTEPLDFSPFYSPPGYQVFYSSCINETGAPPQPAAHIGQIISENMNEWLTPDRVADADYLIATNGNAVAYVDHNENLNANITVRYLDGTISAFASRNKTILKYCEPSDPQYPQCDESVWEVQNAGSLDPVLLAVILTDRGNKEFACLSSSPILNYLLGSIFGTVMVAATTGIVVLIHKYSKRRHYEEIHSIN